MRGPRRAPHNAAAGRLDQADDSSAVRAIRLEQLEHPGVIAAAFPREHRADQVRQVVVADAHGVGVAQRTDRDLGRGPRSEAGQRRQPGVCLVEGQVDGRLEPGGPGRDPSDDLGPPAFDAERVVPVVGERGQPFGRRRQPQVERVRARRRFAEGPDQATEGSPCLLAGHLLLEDPRNERLEDRTTPPDAHAPEAAVELGDHGMQRPEAGAVVVEPDQPRNGGEGTVGAGSPRLGEHGVALDLERDRGGTVRGARRAPAAAVRETHRRVAVSAPQRGQRPGQIERSIDRDSERGHGPSLARPAHVRAIGCDPVPRPRRASPVSVRLDVRHPRVVALVALTAAIAAVAVPGPVGSRAPSLALETDPDLFAQVEVAAAVQGPATTIQPLDPGSRSAGALDERSTLIEPAKRTEAPEGRVTAAQPKAKGGAIVKNTWKRDPEISWYGGGLFGNGTACGQTYTKTIMGVAHRTLPCGTKVQFRHNGKVVTVPVIDRGPYVDDRQFDLSYGACKALNHCFTGPIEWR